jgi:hypothetical protein
MFYFMPEDRDGGKDIPFDIDELAIEIIIEISNITLATHTHYSIL